MKENINQNYQEESVPERDQPNKESSYLVYTIIILSFLLLLSGFTIYAFTAAFQEKPREQKGVDFPFEKEVTVAFTSPEDIPGQIKNVSVRNSDSNETLEVVFQQRKNPLFVTEMLENPEQTLSSELKNNIESFSIGIHKGEIFLLATFKKDAFSLMSAHSEDFFRVVETFTGRKSTETTERLERSNTKIVIRDNSTVYGFLNRRTVAVTETEESFLNILDIYRPSY